MMVHLEGLSNSEGAKTEVISPAEGMGKDETERGNNIGDQEVF